MWQLSPMLLFLLHLLRETGHLRVTFASSDLDTFIEVYVCFVAEHAAYRVNIAVTPYHANSTYGAEVELTGASFSAVDSVLQLLNAHNKVCTTFTYRELSEAEELTVDDLFRADYARVLRRRFRASLRPPPALQVSALALLRQRELLDIKVHRSYLGRLLPQETAS